MKWKQIVAVIVLISALVGYSLILFPHKPTPEQTQQVLEFVKAPFSLLDLILGIGLTISFWQLLMGWVFLPEIKQAKLPWLANGIIWSIVMFGLFTSAIAGEFIFRFKHGLSVIRTDFVYGAFSSLAVIIAAGVIDFLLTIRKKIKDPEGGLPGRSYTDSRGVVFRIYDRLTTKDAERIQ